jgi:magnesium chelatase family protein
MPHNHDIHCIEERDGQLYCKLGDPSTAPSFGPKGSYPDKTTRVLMAVQRSAESARSANRALLVVAPRGAGAVMGLRRFAEKFYPRRSEDEALRLAKKLGVDEEKLVPGYVGMLRNNVRWPHHTVSSAGLTGSKKHPGEMHLARHGMLVLDEVDEFSHRALDALHEAIAKDGHPIFIAGISYQPSTSMRRFETLFNPTVVRI